MVFEQLRPTGGDYALGIHAVLDGEGNTVQRSPYLPAGSSGLGLPGPFHHPVGECDEGVQPWVDCLDPVQVGLRHLHRRQLPVSDAPGQGGGIGVDYLVGHVRPPVSSFLLSRESRTG